LTAVVAKFTDVFNERGKKYVDAIAAGIERFATYIEGIDIGQKVDQFFEFIATAKKVADFLAPLVPMILALVVAIKTITIAQGIYNAVMFATAHPVVLVIAAIAALVVGITWLVKNWDLVIAGFEWVRDNALGIVISVGQSILKFWLTPINLVVDAIQGLLGLVSKIPGVGKLADGISDGIEKVQGTINKALTGSAGTFDYAGTWGSNVGGYASPGTRGAESRTYSESRTINEVRLTATPGTQMAPAGGAPARTLKYGERQ
jgi:hypothetical protein